MSRTYKAVQVTQPGRLEIVGREMIEPALGKLESVSRPVASATLMLLRLKAVFPDSLSRACPAMK